MPGPTWRDVEREIEAADPETDEANHADVWRAFLDNMHPVEMDSLAEEEALRKFWTARAADVDPEDLDDMSREEIDEFDERIRQEITSSPV